LHCVALESDCVDKPTEPVFINVFVYIDLGLHGDRLSYGTPLLVGELYPLRAFSPSDLIGDLIANGRLLSLTSRVSHRLPLVEVRLPALIAHRELDIGLPLHANKSYR
jgi:hypothetical protein